MAQPNQPVDFASALDKPWWKKTSTWIPVVSLVVSGVALLIAIRSSLIAGRSLELSTREFVAQRQPIWVATSVDKEDTLALKPLEAGMALQSAHVIYPNEVSSQDWTVLPPDFRLYLVSPKFGLAQALVRRLPPKKGYAQVSLGAHVPVIITAHYAVKGEGFVDRSMYALTFDFVVHDDRPYDPVSITFTGMEFDRRLAPTESDRATLEILWSSVYQPPKREASGMTKKPGLSKWGQVYF